MENKCTLNIDQFRSNLQDQLDSIVPTVASMTVVELVHRNLDMIKEFKNKGLTLKEICEKFHISGAAITYNSFWKAYKEATKDSK